MDVRTSKIVVMAFQQEVAALKDFVLKKRVSGNDLGFNGSRVPALRP